MFNKLKRILDRTGEEIQNTACYVQEQHEVFINTIIERQELMDKELEAFGEYLKSLEEFFEENDVEKKEVV